MHGPFNGSDDLTLKLFSARGHRSNRLFFARIDGLERAEHPCTFQISAGEVCAELAIKTDGTC
jgi:hypothetical protein